MLWMTCRGHLRWRVAWFCWCCCWAFGGRWRRQRVALALALIGDVLVTAGCLGLPRAPISVWSSGVIGRVKGLGLDLLSGRLSR